MKYKDELKEYNTNLVPVKLPKKLQRIRNSMSQRLKIIILTILGYSLILGSVGIFVDKQFKEVLYRHDEISILNKVKKNQIIYYNLLDNTKIKLHKNKTFYIMNYDGKWIMFYRDNNKVAYENVTNEHKTVELYGDQLRNIFLLAALALVLLSLILSRAYMKPFIIALKQKKNFIADVAHEFKTPMTIIQNNMERLLEKPNDTIINQAENVANTVKEIRHLNRLISDLLILSQADANVSLFNFDIFDLSQTVNEVYDVLKFNAIKRKQLFKLNIPKTLKIIGDEQKIHQLLVILIDNAIKYTPDNAKIELNVKVNNNICIEIKDYGNGITDDNKIHLFDRFYRVDKARSRSTGGHGLGLSIAKWIVQGHNGNIIVTDTIPKGTTFKIMIPKTQKIKKRKQK